MGEMVDRRVYHWLGLGLGLIDKEIIEYLSEGMVTGIWEKLTPIITGMRKNFQDLFESFEYLYNELKNSEHAVNVSGTSTNHR